MADLKWKVENALNRDVERQHLNKILADILSQFTILEQKVTGPGSSIGNIKDVVGEMVENNTENGISVSYDLANKVLDFVISSFVITLSGDVTGEGIVSSNSNVTIPVTIDPQLLGISDAPVDSNAYWRRTGAWEPVGTNLEQLQTILGPGFPAASALSTWVMREFEAAAGELTVANADGEAGNVLYGLADLIDTGVGASPIQLFSRDTKGRIEGTEDADTDDLPEGSNLYFTDERAQDAVGTILVDSADIELDYNDAIPEISAILTTAIHDSLDLADTALQSGDNISELVNDVGFLESVQAGTNVTIDATDPLNPIINATAGGGGIVATVVGGTGIDVDSTDPANPIVSLDSVTIASLALADSSLQPGDNVSELLNDSGYLTSATGQPLDATLTALAGADWAANAIPVGTGADTLAQTSFGANTFPARSSAGNLSAKTISDFGLSLVDDASATDARTTLGITDGTYTPTITNVTNVSTTTPQIWQWLRVGNTVTMSGRVDVTATVGAGTLTTIGISLPVASNFSTGVQCAGAGGAGYNPIATALITADATNNRAQLSFYASGTASVAVLCTMTYLVV